MENLEDLRLEINQIDQDLLGLLKRRLDVVEKIGEIKRTKGLHVRDPKREDQMIEKLSEIGQKMGIEREIIEKIWQTLFEISYKIER